MTKCKGKPFGILKLGRYIYMKLFLTAILSFFLVGLQAQFYSGSQQQFGKNRVQYQDFYWQYYRYQKFDTYFYQEGEDLAAYVSKRAYQIIPALENKFEFVFENKLNFIVYKSFSDFKQSNIGLTNDETGNIGGKTRIVGNKVFVFYEGSHEKLEEQLNAGIAEAIFQQMLYGGKFTEALRSSSFLQLPAWFKNGLISHVGKGWDVETDNLVRDGLLNDKFEQFNHLVGEDATIAGHAIWNFISEKYGDRVIPGIIYMTRVTRNVEDGFKYVLGLDLELLQSDFLAFYSERYLSEEKVRDTPSNLTSIPVKTKKDRIYTRVALSPDGFWMAYVSNILGQYRIYIYDLENETGKRKIHKGEHKLNRITDYSYPVITWHPSGDILAYVVEKKGKVFLNLYSVSEKSTTERELFGVDKILSMDFSMDGKTMLFSAAVKGSTNIYRYFVTGNRMEQLTSSPYDEIEARFASDDTKMVYASNLPDSAKGSADKLHSSSYDLFERPLLTKGVGPATRLTKTKDENERNPFDYGNNTYSFLGDKNGVVNRFTSKYDSMVVSIDTTINYRFFSTAYPLSNYNRSILDYDVQKDIGKYAVLMKLNGEYQFFIGDVENDKQETLSALKKESLKSIQRINFDQIDSSYFIKDNGPSLDSIIAGKRAIKVPIPEVEKEFDIRNYLFADEGLPEIKEKKELTKNEKLFIGETKNQFEIPQRRIYQLNYTYDELLTQVDNQFQGSFYQLLYAASMK